MCETAGQLCFKMPHVNYRYAVFTYFVHKLVEVLCLLLVQPLARFIENQELWILDNSAA